MLLTNDDGIEADGLQALRRRLLTVPGVELAVIAPDGNRSAMARSITTRRPLWVREVDFGDGTVGYATDGTPVDCVRLANLGLIDGFEAEMVVSGINHGANLGDDITYSGTVAAALEALMLGLPGIAVSQQSTAGELDFTLRAGVRLRRAPRRSRPRLVSELRELPLPAGTLLNINVPGGAADGRRGRAAGQARVPRRAVAARTTTADGRQYRIYGEADYERDETGTDLAAVAARADRGHADPLRPHLPATDIEALAGYDLARLVEPVPPTSCSRQ